MRKNMKTSAVLASTMAVFAILSSCQVQEMESQGPEFLPGKEFHARIGEALTKTELSGDDATGYDVVWQNGDVITIKNGGGTVGLFTAKDAGSTQTDFRRTDGYEGAAPYQAWYPAGIYNDGSPALPATHAYSPGNLTGSPMYAESTTPDLLFKNIGGVIRLKISTALADLQIKKIILSADQGLSGPITNAATLAADNYIAAVATGGILTMDCGDGVAIGTTPTPFYMFVPANSYTGLSITAVSAIGVRQTWTLKAGKAVEVGRSQITDISLEFTKQLDYTDLSAKGTANTYIVSTAGSYKFKATVKGNGGLDPVTGTTATGLQKSDISGVTVLWELAEYGKAIAYDSGVYEIGYFDGYVYFSTPETFAQGNAYVAVFKDAAGGTAGVYDKGVDEILWSWLIWATPVPGETEYNGSLFMDRNLGATEPNGSRGFLYQWGRKDPFSAATGSYAPFTYAPAASVAFSTIAGIQTIDYCIKHPTTHVNNGDANSWMSEAEYNLRPWRDDEKTIYDPCPLGWRVPTAAQQNGFAGLPGTGFSNAANEYGNPGSGYYRSSTISAYPKAYAFRQSGEQNDWGTNPAMAIRPVEDTSVAKDLSEYTDLSAEATANCYIVPAQGDYKFLATVKGNGAASLAGINTSTSASSIAEAALVWVSFGSTAAPAAGEVIRKIGYQDGYVYFSTGVEYLEGNAVVAIKDANGNILWSWHLWFTDDNLENSLQTYPVGAVFMDRNLGALDANTAPLNYGLLYQWGRKDPFQNTNYSASTYGFNNSSGTSYLPPVRGTAETRVQIDASTYTLAETIATPTKFVFPSPYSLNSQYSSEWACDMTDELWGEEKTIFDPCPPGYRVPSSWQWSGGFMDAFLAINSPTPNLSIDGQQYTIPFGAFRIRTQLTWYSGSTTYYRCYGRGAVEMPYVYQYHFWAEDGLLVNSQYNGPSTGSRKAFLTLDDMSSKGKTCNYYPDNFCAGFNVRCVTESSIRVRPTAINLNKTSATLSEEGTLQLVASFVPADVTMTGITWSSTDETIASVDENGLVTAWKPGSCNIVATSIDVPSVSKSCTITVSATSRAAVDLGLPSGTKWANLNLGANYTAGAGARYAWGETSTKETYTQSNYRFGSNALSPTKYTNDTIQILENADDAAYVNWGNRWHIPSKDEWRELKNYCNYSRVTRGSVEGMLVTSRSTGNSIFIPLAEYWTNTLDYAPAYGSYQNQYATTCEFSYYTQFGEYSKYRYNGLYIRPVYR